MKRPEPEYMRTRDRVLVLALGVLIFLPILAMVVLVRGA